MLLKCGKTAENSLIGLFLSEARTKVIIIPHYINWVQTETLQPQRLNQPEKRDRSDTSTTQKSLGIPPFPWHYCVCVDAFCGGCNGRVESSVRGWLCNLGVIAPSPPHPSSELAVRCDCDVCFVLTGTNNSVYLNRLPYAYPPCSSGNQITVTLQ